MPEPFNLQRNARAMLAYALRVAAQDPYLDRAQPWHGSYRGRIEKQREAIRVEERGGGMCHLVSEWLWDHFGWARMSVSYLDRTGRVICCGHYVNVLPDGTLVDGTADQFGEGHSVRRLKPADPEYGRYRPEFDEEINPSTRSELRDFHWSRWDDWDEEAHLRKTLGLAWWVSDPTKYIAYLQHQVALGGVEYQTWLQRLLVRQQQQRTSAAKAVAA